MSWPVSPSLSNPLSLSLVFALLIIKLDSNVTKMHELQCVI